MPGKVSTRQYGIKVYSGPVATVYACPRCKHMEQFRNGLPGVGRGHGLRMGGGCYSRMVAHVRREHPDQPKHPILVPGDRVAFTGRVMGPSNRGRIIRLLGSDGALVLFDDAGQRSCHLSDLAKLKG